MMIKAIIKYLNALGIEAWICGGTARDIYRGVEPRGIDVAVNITLLDLQSKIKTKLVQVNDFSTSVTIIYKDTKVTLYPLKKIELINTYYNYSFTSSLKEDALSRDFTMNALYWNPITEEWFDYFDGRKDIDNKIIRFVDDPFTRILESKIRILRAFMFNATLGDGWVIEAKSIAAIFKYKLKAMTTNIRQLLPELIKVFEYAEKPSKFFYSLKFIDLLPDFFIELHRCIGIEQSNKAVGLDLFKHIMLTLDAIPVGKENTVILRLAALLHDIGKPYTEVENTSGIHFYNHENVGAYIAEKIMYRWGFPRTTIDQVSNLIINHLFDASPQKTDNSIKKLIQKVGAENIHDLIELRIADRIGTGRSDISLTNIKFLQTRINKLLLTINPLQFKLDLDDSALQNILSQYTTLTDTTLQITKQFLKEKILSEDLKNQANDLKYELQKLLDLKCPLGVDHIITTWADINKNSEDSFLNGNLKCGVFCNFLCSKYIDNLKTPINS